MPVNSRNFSHCLNVSTVAAITAGTIQTLVILQYRKRNGKRREGRNDEKGLQCPEFLTWKVGNPRS